MTTELILFLPDEAATLAFGARLAQATTVPMVMFMHGQLGAGKTTLARGILRGLGYADRVKSPTYTLVESYELANAVQLFHFDLYRLQDPYELEFMGIQDYFTAQAVCLVEWPEMGVGVLPPADLVCQLKSIRGGREITLSGHSAHGQTIIQRLRHE
jgi:tRNA threonylcarbamoyladenosine biosynthesis protein TsaE